MTETTPQTEQIDTQTTESPSFASLDLDPQLLAGLHSIGFTKCTPIQAQTLPLTLQGNDVAGQAQTGTGKTAAFLIATIQKLLSTQTVTERKKSDPRALIIAPTRELAIQIHKDFLDIGKTTQLKSVLVYGGTGIVTQREELQKGVDLLIGTPGRVIDYFKQGVFSLKYLDVMVLDEADRMFDLGFIQDIRYLYRHMPPAGERLTLMFSATFSQRVLELAYEHMHEPKFMRIQTDSITAENITQKIYFPSKEQKKPLLVQQLNNLDDNSRVLVFINTKREGEYLEATLQANGFHAQVFSGDVKQSRRQSMLAAFRSGKLPIMIATDVAARGLHIPDVTHVFNYDLPNNREDYVHRIGRTARAGASGHAISFGCDDYVMVLPEIEDYIGYKIPVEQELPELPEIEFAKRPERKPRHGDKRQAGGKGRRNEKQPERNRPDKEYKSEHDDDDKEKQSAFHQQRVDEKQHEQYLKRQHKLRLRSALIPSFNDNVDKKKQARYSMPALKDRESDQSVI